MARSAPDPPLAAASPTRPKRPVSAVHNIDVTPNGRAKRSRRGPAPKYNIEDSEDEKTADLSPSKIQRKGNGSAANGDSNSRQFVAEPHIGATSKDSPASNRLKKRIPKGGHAQTSTESQETFEEIQSPALIQNAKGDTAVNKSAVKSKSKLAATLDKQGAILHNEGVDRPDSKPKARRKTKEEKEAEAMPLAARSVGSRVFVGAHVSAAGGVHNSITQALHIGGNAFALFQKSQRKWDNPKLNPEHADQFKALCATHSYAATSHVVPHGSYLVNLAQPDPIKAEQAYVSFLDDLQRSESLGIKLYNFHPGNTNGEPRPLAIRRISERLNAAHKATSTVVTLLENMAASTTGNTIGGCFEDLRDVIDLIEDKTRVGVCLDTCHAFAAGYDLRTPEAFAKSMSNFDEVVGFQYLRAVHLNDSKAPFASHRDLHQNIGVGFLGLRAFHSLVNDRRFAGLPLILETPIGKKDEHGKAVEDKNVWAREIKLLESLVDMDPEGNEFKALEKDLADKGAAERAQFEQKQDEKMKQGKSKGKRSRRESTEESDEET